MATTRPPLRSCSAHTSCYGDRAECDGDIGSNMAPDTATLYQLNLRGGGGDLACGTCLPMAKKERGPDGDGSLVSVAKVSAPGESCAYCGIEGAR